MIECKIESYEYESWSHLDLLKGLWQVRCETWILLQ